MVLGWCVGVLHGQIYIDTQSIAIALSEFQNGDMLFAKRILMLTELIITFRIVTIFYTRCKFNESKQTPAVAACTEMLADPEGLYVGPNALSQNHTNAPTAPTGLFRGLFRGPSNANQLFQNHTDQLFQSHNEQLFHPEFGKFTQQSPIPRIFTTIRDTKRSVIGTMMCIARWRLYCHVTAHICLVCICSARHTGSFQTDRYKYNCNEGQWSWNIEGLILQTRMIKHLVRTASESR